jgi:hypothetical protein
MGREGLDESQMKVGLQSIIHSARTRRSLLESQAYRDRGLLVK